MTERVTVDARGTVCPSPLLELIKTIKVINIGEEIEILTSDIGSAKDIPVWATKVGHTMGEVTKFADHWSVVVIKEK